MTQRGRKPAAPPGVARPLLAKGRPKPPHGLPEAAQAHWIVIVSSLEAAYFVESDLPLLSAYVRALAAHDYARSRLEEEGPVNAAGKASAWLVVVEKECRACVALAARLRLAPQSRIDRTVAGKHARPQHGPAPWETDDEELLAGSSEERFFRGRQ